MDAIVEVLRQAWARIWARRRAQAAAELPQGDKVIKDMEQDGAALRQAAKDAPKDPPR